MAANQRAKTKELKLEYFDLAKEEGEKEYEKQKQATQVKQYEEKKPEPKDRSQGEQDNVLKAVKIGGRQLAIPLYLVSSIINSSQLTEKNLKKLEEESVRAELEKLEQHYNVKADDLQRVRSVL